MIGVTTAILALAVAQAPLGGAPSEAHQVVSLYELGTRAYRQAHFSEALEYFLEIDELVPAASTAFNVALAAKGAQENALAYNYFERCVRSPDVEPAEVRRSQAFMAQLAPRLALVEVVTSPPGAEVSVSGWHLGTYGRAPLTLALETGERHLILARKAGWQEGDTEIRAQRGARTHTTLVLQRSMGRLTISTNVSDAHIKATGTATVTLQVGVTTSVPAGRYEVRVDHPEYQAQSVIVDIPPGGHEQRQLPLRPLAPLKARLIVVTGDRPADIFLGERRVAVTPSVMSLDPGSHKIRLERDGKVLTTREIKLGPREAVVVDLRGAEGG